MNGPGQFSPWLGRVLGAVYPAPPPPPLVPLAEQFLEEDERPVAETLTSTLPRRNPHRRLFRFSKKSMPTKRLYLVQDFGISGHGGSTGFLTPNPQ